jgi:hypothetical protein
MTDLGFGHLTDGERDADTAVDLTAETDTVLAT